MGLVLYESYAVPISTFGHIGYQESGVMIPCHTSSESNTLRSITKELIPADPNAQSK